MSDSTRRTQEELKDNIGPVACFIREQRRILGYTQKEFATRVGVGIRFLRDLELGKKTARMDKVNQVLYFLGHQLEPRPIDHAEDVSHA